MASIEPIWNKEQLKALAVFYKNRRAKQLYTYRPWRVPSSLDKLG